MHQPPARDASLMALTAPISVAALRFPHWFLFLLLGHVVPFHGTFVRATPRWTWSPIRSSCRARNRWPTQFTRGSRRRSRSCRTREEARQSRKRTRQPVRDVHRTHRRVNVADSSIRSSVFGVAHSPLTDQHSLASRLSKTTGRRRPLRGAGAQQQTLPALPEDQGFHGRVEEACYS